MLDNVHVGSLFIPTFFLQFCPQLSVTGFLFLHLPGSTGSVVMADTANTVVNVDTADTVNLLHIAHTGVSPVRFLLAVAAIRWCVCAQHGFYYKDLLAASPFQN